jgi:hypothetical protein
MAYADCGLNDVIFEPYFYSTTGLFYIQDIICVAF